MKKLLGIALASMMLVGCTQVAVYDNKTVDAVVVDKEYKKSYTTHVMSGKVLVPIRHPEKHFVTLQYKDVRDTIENESLYNLVEIGSSLPVNYKVGKNANGDIVRESLELLGID